MANKSLDDSELCEELIRTSKMELGVDIDSLLNEKAQKNQLNKRNVKLLIKNILTNDDVVTMLKQTLDENIDGNCLYEPKLTRARIREMLKTYPSSVEQWSQNQQQSIISECRSLIDQEFPDDSEDEEYKPEPQIEDDYDDDYDDIFKCSTIQLSEAENVNTNDEEDLNTSAELDEETIGMRTRSKFPLNDTPLETIEQAFIPPDITEDMYDSACENDEWMEFLSEFTKPLEPIQNDDTEDDPEYNVLGDAEFSNVVDKEEFRKDKAVKITRKEYNALMSELNEYSESINFNGVEEYEENDTVITECDETAVTSKNSSPPNTINSNYLDCESYNTNHRKYKNAFDLGNSSAVYTLNFVECNSNNAYFTNEKNLKKSSKSSRNWLSSNYFNGLLNNDKSVTNYQIKEAGGYSSQINDSQSNNQTICNNQLENSNVVFNCPTNVHSAKNSKTETINSCHQNTTICDQNNTMLPKQIILLKQQLTQHVQLLTQSYLLCSMKRTLKSHCLKLKIMMESIKNVSHNKKFEPLNIHSASKFIQEWKNAKTFQSYLDKDCDKLPLDLKQLMLFYDEPVFIYPMLLPVRTFNNIKTCPIGDSEERILVLKIDYVFKRLKYGKITRAKYKKQNILDMLPVILKTVHGRWFSYRKLTDLKKYIYRRRNRPVMSPLKNYLLYGNIDETVHVVDIGSLFIGKCLYECSIDKFPWSWRPLVKYLMLKKTT